VAIQTDAPRQFLGPVDQMLEQIRIHRRLSVLTTGWTAVLVVGHLDPERPVEASVDIQVGILAIVGADEKDCDLLRCREEHHHAVVVAQLEDTEVLYVGTRESVVGGRTTDPLKRRSRFFTSRACAPRSPLTSLTASRVSCQMSKGDSESLGPLTALTALCLRKRGAEVLVLSQFLQLELVQQRSG
jgi:hypothetical protein